MNAPTRNNCYARQKGTEFSLLQIDPHSGWEGGADRHPLDLDVEDEENSTSKKTGGNDGGRFITHKGREGLLSKKFRLDT